MRLLGFDIRRAATSAPEVRSSLENPQVSLSDPAALASMGLAEAGGITVSPGSALGVSAVYACVFIIAKTFAWLPCPLVQKLDGRTRHASEHPLYRIFADRPNSYQTPYNFRLTTAAQALLWGNGYAEIQRDVRTGRALGLYPIAAWNCEAQLKAGIKSYRAGGVTMNDGDVLHFMAPGIDGIRGLSPIRQHRMTVGMALEALAYGEQFYRNGTRLAGALSHPKKLTPEAAAALRASWTAIYAGKSNAGKVAVLEEGMEFKPFTMPMDDAQYIETRKFSVSDIARIYGVPPHKIGDLDKATFSNIEHQGIEFVQDCMMPWLVQFEQEANAKLLTEEERAAGYSFKHNVKALLRGDMKSQAEFLKIIRELGAYSVDDVLERLDENPVGGTGGDERIRPMNYVPIGTPATDPAPADPASN